MWTWILIGALYAFSMGFFSLLGGMRAAGDAFRRWGETASDRERSLSSSF
jgi:hypothetical protein